MAEQPWATISLGPTLTFLRELSERAGKLRPVLNGPIANAIHGMFEKQFATQGVYGGDQWEPLSDKTLAWRVRHNRVSLPTLQFTRELWSSLVKRSSPLGYRIADNDSLIMGTSVQYAEKHQLGLGHLFARQIVPEEIPEADTQEWARLVVEHLEAA